MANATERKNGGLTIDPANVSTKFLADVLGLSTTMVSQLYAQRVIKQNGKRGKYDITVAVPQYIESIRTSGTAEAAAKLKIQQERKLQLANDEHAGLLVRIADAAEAYRAACIAWRAGASALPRRLATAFSNESSANKIRKVLTDEISELYTEFEKPLAKYFSDRKHPFTTDVAGVAGTKAKPKKNTRTVGKRKQNSASRKRGTRKVAQ